jgi:hypothetical protein
LYLATVNVCNVAGRCISITSNGIKFVNPPQIESVIDGFQELDIDQQSNTSQLCGSWSNVSDDGVQVLEYSVAFLSCDSDEVPQFVNVGLKEEFCFQKLALKVQTAYCIILRATNIAGLMSEARSDGVMVCAPPSTQKASVKHNIFFSGVGALQVFWSGFHHSGAPITSFTITILSKNGTNLFDPLSSGAWWNFTFHNLNISICGTYFVQVCAIDLLEQYACKESDGFSVDKTNPLTGQVVNGPFLYNHVHLQSSNRRLLDINKLRHRTRGQKPSGARQALQTSHQPERLHWPSPQTSD